MIKSGYGYFHFSKEQQDKRTKSESKLGKIFVPGKVVVKGKEKTFTQITRTVDHRFSDSKIVAEGNLEDMSYVEPYAD